MRTPLFVLIRLWRGNARAPKELRHSGILSKQWAVENNRCAWTFYWERHTGTDAIDEFCARVFRDKGPVRLHEAAEVKLTFARRTYDASSQVSLYERRSGDQRRSGCFVRDDDDQRLYFGGRQALFTKRVIRIHPAPMRRCRWCDAQTHFKPGWIAYDGTIRCNRPDCRRLDYLEDKPQSRGGIDLTPRQRKGLDRSGWRTQKLINYLMLVAKETRNG